MIYTAGKAIGPMFPYELQAAGLLGLPFAWGADGVFEFNDSMPAATVAAVKVVIAAHNPLTPITPVQAGKNIQASFDSGKLVKAVALVLLAELNTVRAALVPPLPPLTQAQLAAEIIALFQTLP